MALHPIQPIEIAHEQGYLINPGHNACGSFILSEDETLGFRFIHNMAVQDFSVRCWFSTVPGGSMLDSVHPMRSYWHPGRASTFELVLYSSDEPILNPNTTSHIIKAPPGTYYLNALNLVNAPNSFYMSMRVGPVDD